MKPRLLITSASKIQADTKKVKYISAVELAGGTAELSGLIDSDFKAHQLAREFNGLILSGGGDVDPKLYHQSRHLTTVNINNMLDDTEKKLILAFRNMNKPVLAICRGIQILHVVYGGELIQHIPDIANKHEHNNDDMRHPVTVTGGILADIFGVNTILCVNSTHHQAVSKIICCETLCAMSDDDIIESFSIGDNILAVQFHPERMYCCFEPLWQWFIKKAQN